MSDIFDSVNQHEDEFGKWVTASLVQRARYRTQSQQVAQKINNPKCISDFFNLDYMGATEYECGCLARRILELVDNCKSGIVFINNTKVWMFYNPKHYDAAGAEYQLNQLYNQKNYTKGYTAFTESYLAKPDSFDTWFEIQGGLFWTTNKVAARKIPDAITESALIILENRKKAHG